MSTPHFTNIAAAPELENWGPLKLPLAESLEGDIATAGKELWKSPDGRTSTGTWQCAPGKSRWDFKTNGEFIHVLSGEMIVVEEGQAAITLRAGDTAVFPKGWRGTWQVTKTLRKVYTIFPE